MVRTNLRIPSTLLILFLLAGGVRGADGLVITEFMAINERTLADEDGDYSDWIEIYNSGSSTVDLDGWWLSDRIDHARKWRFPAVSLAPSRYLIVFASEKNRATAGGELHTSFKLTGEREFLGLTDPLGNLVSAYTPQFPVQFPSVSYGFTQSSSPLTLIGEGAAGRVLVPANGTLGTTWTSIAFADGSWTAATTGVGYDTGTDYGALIGTDIEAAMRTRNASAYLRLPFQIADPSGIDSLKLRMMYDDGYVAYLNGTVVARRNAPATALWSSTATTEHGQPTSGSMSQDFDAPGTAYVLTNHIDASPMEVVGGGPDGAFLRLLPENTADLTNTAGFAKGFTGASDVVIAEFDYRMPTEAGHTGCCGERADGFGFALLSTIEYGDSGAAPYLNVAWERPTFTDAFSVGFDIFDGTGAENTVNLNWNGVEVGAVRVAQFQLNNGVFNRVRVEIRRDGADSLVSLRITPNSLETPGAPVQVFTDHLVTGMAPFESRVAFGGRTGGAFVALDLDNVSVQYLPASDVIQYEDVDISAHISRLQAGTNVLAIHGLNRTASDADFLIRPILEAVDFGRVDTGAKLYFQQPTPGAPNGPGIAEVAAEPVFSRMSGAYNANFSLTLSAPAGTTIRYTTNGTEPTASSTLYSAAISVNRDMVVRAKSFKTGALASRTVEMVYIRPDATVSAFSSDLPLVVLDSFGQGIGQSGFTQVSGIFIDTSTTTLRARMTDAPNFAGSGGLKIRGSSSTGFPKRQFAFEVWNGNRLDRDAAILGFSEEADYIIYGPYTDKTLMRDVLAYEWSNRIGRWAVRTRFVEVFVKTTAGNLLTMGDHVGVYAFMEKIKRDRTRVDLANLLPSHDAEPEISGGYILKKDRLDPGDTGMTTSRGHVLGFVDPKEQEITPAQRAWIKGYLDTFESALYGAGFTDPVNGYRKYIDVGSFIDHHIMVEVTKNIDGYRLSTFMHKDRGGKLHMGPVWDYNLTLGNANYLDGWKPDGWYHVLVGDGDYPWYRRLFQDPDFQQQYIDRWTELRRTHFVAQDMLDLVDLTADFLQESQVRNFQRWPILGSYVWPNWYIGNTYQEEVDWMKGWLSARLDWIDSNYLGAPFMNQQGGVIVPGFQLQMGAAVGTIYYTLDGTDPRLPGGGVRPGALQHGSSQQTVLVPPAAPRVRAFVPTADIGTGWTGVGFADAAWPTSTAGVGVGYDTAPDYRALIHLDVAAMQGANASVYIRVPFNVADRTAFDSLVLKMKYDDAFVAFLNGTRIADRGGVPDPLAWNSAVGAARDEGAAVTFESINVTQHLGLLRNGANVLAIQGINAGAGSSDLLIVPELTASASFSGGGIPLDGPTRVVARANLGAQWSGPTDASFVLDVPIHLRVTELMYHPQDPPAGSLWDADDFEFIEITNVGSSPANLLGVRFESGVEFDFSSGAVTSLAPGEYLLVVKDRQAFSSRYATQGLRIAGEYRGNLDNDGEGLLLIDGRGEIVMNFLYDDLWYPDTDGTGTSLHIQDEEGNPLSWSDRLSWAPSAEVGGSPGESESAPPPGGLQRPGDGNQNGALDLSDAVGLLLHLFGGVKPPLACEGTLAEGGNLALLDVNGDGAVGLPDPVTILTHLYRSGPAPTLGTSCVRLVGCPSACGL